MPDFIWIAKDKFGRAVTRQLAAQSVEQAKESLVYQGYTDLQLIHDEYTTATMREKGLLVEVSGERHVVSAEAIVEGRQKDFSSIWAVFVDSLKEHRKTLCLILLIATCAYFSHHQIFAAIALLAMPALLLFNIWISLPVILYMKVNRASLWNRWDEVLRRTEILCRLQRFHTAKYFPDYEFPRLRAVALAGKGQVDAALAEMKHLESDPGCERCIYYSELAFVCELSKQVDQSIELTQRAIQEKPLPVFHLQLASRYLRLKKDLARARAAFERVDKDTLLHDQHSSYHLVRGALDFRDGNFVAARAEMETALALQASAPPSPASEVLMLIIKAALSRVIARQGDLATAARYFDEAEAYLIAIKDIENLQECRQLLGRA